MRHMASAVRALGLLWVVSCLSGCFAQDYGTPGITITNDTSGTVEVIYRRQVRPTPNVVDDLVAEIGVGQRQTVIGLHQAEGPASAAP